MKNGNIENGIAVSVPVEIDTNLNNVQIPLNASTLDTLISSNVKRFTIDVNRMAEISFTLDTLKELNTQSSSDIAIQIKQADVSSNEGKAAIGSRPVYDINIHAVKEGKENPITTLNGKTVSIAIPYTPSNGEVIGNLHAVYVDGSGKVNWLTKSSYNADQKAVIFETEHFSVYGIGYKTDLPAFTDIENHWAREDIVFAASRGLFSGTSDTTFSPDMSLSRAMFVTALGKLAGINPDSYKKGKFTDVAMDAYYAPYVNWAAQSGIVSGTSETTFAPNSNITREQMAVIMNNYMEKMGYTIPKTLVVMTFTDDAQISSWAKDSVKAMQQAGIFSGKAGNKVDPKGLATRAEATAVIHRFVEVVIDPQSANGWRKNDSGEWYYYKDGEQSKGWIFDNQKWYWLNNLDGKMFAGGWKEIDSKWYYFYSDGLMAANTIIDGYKIGADGAMING